MGRSDVRIPVNEVLHFDVSRAEDLRAFLQKSGYALESRPNAFLFAQRPGVSLTVYRTGKILVTGAQASEVAGVLRGHGLAKGEVAAPPAHVPPSVFAPHVGSDESGKGDYFGPLAVASVFIPDIETSRALREKGVRDSKTLTDADIGPLSSLIRARCPHATVVLEPAKYNELYERVGNLNTLLAWAHARAIEQVLERVGDAPVIVDQFARPEVLLRQLQELGRAARVEQMVRGEVDVAVAAASIVARAEFLAGLATLEARHGVKLPKGAGPPVVRAGRDVVARKGRVMLREVAKTHFATTRAVLG